MTHFIVVCKRNNYWLELTGDINQMLKDKVKNRVKKGYVLFFIHFVRIFTLTTELQLFILYKK